MSSKHQKPHSDSEDENRSSRHHHSEKKRHRSRSKSNERESRHKKRDYYHDESTAFVEDAYSHESPSKYDRYDKGYYKKDRHYNQDYHSSKSAYYDRYNDDHQGYRRDPHGSREYKSYNKHQDFDYSQEPHPLQIQPPLPPLPIVKPISFTPTQLDHSKVATTDDSAMDNSKFEETIIRKVKEYDFDLEHKAVLEETIPWSLETKSGFRSDNNNSNIDFDILICRRLAGHELFRKVHELRYPKKHRQEELILNEKEDQNKSNNDVQNMSIDDLFNEMKSHAEHSQQHPLQQQSVVPSIVSVDDFLNQFGAELENQQQQQSQSQQQSEQQAMKLEPEVVENSDNNNADSNKDDLHGDNNDNNDNVDDTTGSMGEENNNEDDDDLYGNLNTSDDYNNNDMSGGNDDDLYGDLSLHQQDGDDNDEEEKKVSQTDNEENDNDINNEISKDNDNVNNLVKENNNDQATTTNESVTTLPKSTKDKSVAIGELRDYLNHTAVDRSHYINMPFLLQDISYGRMKLFGKSIKGHGFSSLFLQTLPQISKLLSEETIAT